MLVVLIALDHVGGEGWTENADIVISHGTGITTITYELLMTLLVFRYEKWRHLNLMFEAGLYGFRGRTD